MRDLLVFWMGGAQSPPTTQAGYRGLLVFWAGGTTIVSEAPVFTMRAGSMLASRIVRRRMFRR
jgi:hypothetical protein